MTAGSLRLRLLLAGAAAGLLALAAAAVGLSLLFRHHVERRVDAELAVHLSQLAAGIERLPSGELAVARPPSDPRFSEPLSGLYWQVLLEQPGKALRSRSLWDELLAAPEEPVVDDVVHHHLVRGPGGARLYLAQRRIALPARLGSGTARISVGLDTAEIDKAVWRFAAELTPFLALVGLLLVAAGWAQVTVGLGPLSRVRDRLAAVRADAGARLGRDFPDEVRPLAAEIDALLDDRAAEIARARSRAGDLAHGLRTPLQALAGEIARLEAAGSGAHAEALSSIATAMSRHVERELARSRIASVAAAGAAATDVAAAIDRVLRVIARAPASERLDWNVDIPAGLAARIDQDDLADAIGNLVENAARHAATEVRIRAQRDDSNVVLEVADDGRGIPAELREAALERGNRLETDGPGSGLGLAIVTDIAAAWGGRLELGDAQPGLRAILHLPSAPTSKGEQVSAKRQG